MINTDLERMADLAVDIAERADALAGPPRVPVPDRLQAMTDLALGMFREAMDAFVTLDGRRARRVVRMDDEVDRHHAEIIRDLIGAMKRSPDTVDPTMSLFSAVRHVERFADHATNIAEDVVYLVEGEIVRHRPEALAERG
jgi:phosphate transport system protein